jgi:hypothetical protein
MMRRLLMALLALAFLQRCALADDVVRPIRSAGLLPWATTSYDLALPHHGKRYPDFEIEQHLLLQYPFCKTYYVSRSAPRLAARLTAGLERMVADGSFDALFVGQYGKLPADLNLGRRLPIKLENPFLPAWVQLGRKQLWFDPARMS